MGASVRLRASKPGGETSRRPLRRAAAAAVGGREESGGAATLWVVLMVPIAAFAASVAVAGPQRLAAESSLKEATDDLATLAVAWRDAQDAGEGGLTGFPVDCVATSADENEVTALINAGDSNGANAKRAEIEAFIAKCEEFRVALLRDLGSRGVEVESLRGFYSDSLDLVASVPCSWSPTIEVRDAVHVALAADWGEAGWAAAQVWPDGLKMGSESIGRLERDLAPGSNSVSGNCDPEALEPLDERGRARWLSGDLTARTLTESVPSRTTFGRDGRAP